MRLADFGKFASAVEKSVKRIRVSLYICHILVSLFLRKDKKPMFVGFGGIFLSPETFDSVLTELTKY